MLKNTENIKYSIANLHALFLALMKGFALIVWIKIYSIMGTVYYPCLRNFVLK